MLPMAQVHALAHRWVTSVELYGESACNRAETRRRAKLSKYKDPRLWLHLSDGRVLAVRFGDLERPDDSVIPPVVEALADDIEGTRYALRIQGVGRLHVLYAAPVSPPPAIDISSGKVTGPLIWTPGLDTEILSVLETIQSKEQQLSDLQLANLNSGNWDPARKVKLFFLSVRNYNSFVTIPKELRVRRIQAIERFPALVVPLLLTAHVHPNVFDGRLEAKRWRDSYVETAIDQGRSLAGALALHYGISKGLVRAKVNADYWRSFDGLKSYLHEKLKRVLHFLEALPDNKRPQTSDALAKELVSWLEEYLDLVSDNTLPQSLNPHARAFAKGWEATSQQLRKEYDELLTIRLRDTRDFLYAAVNEAERLSRRDDGPSVNHVGAAWVAQYGIRGLLRDSQRWHRWQSTNRSSGVNLNLSWPTVVGQWDSNGCHASELSSTAALEEEGAKMHHCVGGYWKLCAEDGHRIFSICVNGERATAQYQPRIEGEDVRYQLIQLRGPCNKNVNEQVQEFAERLCDEINIKSRASARMDAINYRSVYKKILAERKAIELDIPKIDLESRSRLLRIFPLLGIEVAPERVIYIGKKFLSNKTNRTGPNKLSIAHRPTPRDPFRVTVYLDGQLIGFVPEPYNVVIADRLARGERLDCRLVRQYPNDGIEYIIEANG